MPPVSLPARSRVLPELTWNIADIYPSDEAWEAEMLRLAGRLEALQRFEGRLGESPAWLLKWFDEWGPLRLAVSRAATYAHMQHDVDTTDQAAAARNARAQALQSQLLSATAFAKPELLAIGFDTLREWMKAEPGLALYDHYFEDLESQQAHVRSAEVEALLGQVTDPFRSAETIHGILANADLKFAPAHAADSVEPIEVAQGNYATALLYSPDRDVRRTAWESYADGHLAYKNTLAACMATGVKHNVFMARARGYTSALEASLSPNHIPLTVFYNLIETYKQNLPTWHRYWGLRRRALGLERLSVYDARAPLTDRMPVVPYAQSVDWIVAGMRPLGQDYVTVLRRGALDERWVDRAQNRGKRAGAYSTGRGCDHPFIMMSYADNLFSLSTLAHELGHSLHSYHTHHTQPPVYDSYSLFVAETASNFNQAMVRAHLLATQPDRDFQIAVIEEAMNNFHRYFFIMPTLARFELEIHERAQRGQALTAESLNQLMADLFREGYGDEVAMDEARVGSTWMHFSTHLYSNFYVYQYATGISAAHALARGVLEGRPGAADRYLAFLKAGSSLYPLEALKLAGVDMTTPEPVVQTFGVLAEMVERLEKLVG